METNESSGLRLYSMGTVAANKKRGSMTIEVVPMEDMPMMDGELTDNTVEYKAKGAGKDGENAFDHDLKTTGSVEATWMPWGNTNRKTAPDVRRGELVILLKYKDADKFYWIESSDPKTLRRRETVTFAWSNESRENVPLDHTNTYWMEVSTHDKYIHLETVKNDGEPFAYVIQLNTKEGVFVLKDDDGNSLMMDSKNRHIKFENKDKSVVELNKRVINIESQDEVNIKTKKFTLNASESITEQTKTKKVSTSTFSHQSQGYTISASSYGATTSSYSINSSVATVSGNFSVGGNLAVAGTSVHAGKSTGPGHV